MHSPPTLPAVCALNRCMPRAWMLSIEREGIVNLPFSILFILFAAERKFHRERKFPLFIFPAFHSSLDIHKLFFSASKFLSGFEFQLHEYALRNNGVKDQRLNSVCWFFACVLRESSDERRRKEAAFPCHAAARNSHPFPMFFRAPKISRARVRIKFIDVPEALKVI